MSEAQDIRPSCRAAGNRRRILVCRVLAVVAIFASGLLTGWYSSRNWGDTVSYGNLQEKHAQADIFINPLVGCDAREPSIEFTELRDFKRSIQERIDRLKKEKGVSSIAVYFRDLNNGPTFGIDQDMRFTPASLMKVPMMIACFKIAEKRPEFLQQKAAKSDAVDFNAMETIKPSQVIVPNRQYTIEDLVRRTVAYSDNNALNLLISNVDNRQIEEIYQDLGIPSPQGALSEDYLTVKEYASFFRILFNASYLNKEMSKKALQFLSEVDFDHGLTGGIPKEIGVVHKFGERIIKNQNMVQFHDCGIIYYPSHPYLLCVMTRGSSLEQTLESIRDISRLTFEQIDKQYRPAR